MNPSSQKNLYKNIYKVHCRKSSHNRNPSNAITAMTSGRAKKSNLLGAKYFTNIKYKEIMMLVCHI